MPYGKKPQTYKRKPMRKYRRKTIRRRRRGAPSRVIVRTPSAFPDRMFAKLRYSEQQQLTFVGFGLPSVTQYRLLGLWDPRFNLGGHQYYARDEYALLYNRYRIHGIKYKITYINKSTTEPQQWLFLLRPNTNTPTDPDVWNELPYSRTGIVGVEGAGGVKTIYGYVSNPKILGITKEAFRTDDRYQALMSADPVAEPLMSVGHISADPTQGADLIVKVDLVAYVEFFDRRLLAKS